MKNFKIMLFALGSALVAQSIQCGGRGWQTTSWTKDIGRDERQQFMRDVNSHALAIKNLLNEDTQESIQAINLHILALKNLLNSNYLSQLTRIEIKGQFNYIVDALTDISKNLTAKAKTKPEFKAVSNDLTTVAQTLASITKIAEYLANKTQAG